MVSLKGIRVLVVEDEPVIALDHAEHLAEAGAEVIGPFPESRAALSELAQTAVDVAVLDYVLRDETSAELQEELDRRHVPIIVVTGYPKVLVRRGEGQEILSKPVDGDRLCTAVLKAGGGSEATVR